GLLFVLLTVLRESEVRHVHQEALINRLINELTGLRAEVMRLTAALDPQAAPETNFWPISSWQQYVDFVVEMPAEHLTSLMPSLSYTACLKTTDGQNLMM
uniref:Sensor histidine kinase n=1 Tax=Macrostomum lignano TaxID=282301 RepID=A0A1I8GW84_9PLAT